MPLPPAMIFRPEDFQIVQWQPQQIAPHPAAAGPAAGPAPPGLLSTTRTSPTGDAAVSRLFTQLARSRIGDATVTDEMEVADHRGK